MNGFVQVPSKGQPMTAQWGADVANGLNSIRSAGQNGMLLTDGPTGTGFSPLPANLRDRRTTPATNKSCFRIESKSVESEIRRFLVDCYYNVGGKTFYVADIDIEDIIPHPEDETSEDGEESDTVIYFAKDSNGGTSVGACYFEELNELQSDEDSYVFPLYAFAADGNIKTDLRTAPQIQMFEEIGQ